MSLVAGVNNTLWPPGIGWLPVRLSFDKCGPAFVLPYVPVHPHDPASEGAPWVTERVCEPPLRGGTRIHALTRPRAESRTAHTLTEGAPQTILVPD